MKHTKITRQVDSFLHFFCRRCLLFLTFIPKRKKIIRKKEEKFKIRFHLRIRERRDTNLCNDFLEFEKKTPKHILDPMAIIIRIRKRIQNELVVVMSKERMEEIVFLGKRRKQMVQFFHLF